MGKTQRRREARVCDSCNQLQTVLYRVKTAEQIDWVFLCSTCQKLSKDTDGYQYGGTWKQKKRN